MLVFVGFILGILIQSCKHDPPPAKTGETCFEADILPLFQTYCSKSGCHNANSAAEGYILDSWSNILNTGDEKGIIPFNANESEIMEAILEDDPNKRMPPVGNPQLSSEQISLLASWINEGAPNTVGCNASACDTTVFQFNAHVKPILNAHCVGCHGGSSPSAGIDLSTHASVFVFAGNGSLVGSIDHLSGYSAMPDGAAQLDDCKRTIVRKWVQAGALDN